MRKLELAGPIAAGLLVSTAAYAAPSGGRARCRQTTPIRPAATARSGRPSPRRTCNRPRRPSAPPQCETVSSDPLDPRRSRNVVLGPQFANHVASSRRSQGRPGLLRPRKCSPALAEGRANGAKPLRRQLSRISKRRTKKASTPADYPVPELAATPEPATTAKAEVDFSASVAKVHPSSRPRPDRAVARVRRKSNTAITRRMQPRC